MISGVLWFGKAYDLKLQCHLASRYMAWATANQAETDLDDSDVMSRVQVYYPMTENEPTYTELDPMDQLFGGSSSVGSFPSSGPLDFVSLLNPMFSMASQTRGYSVGAAYAPDGILDDTLPNGTQVHSQHFVSGGAWHKKQILGDIQIMGVKTALFAWSSYALSQY
jgi:hypothetical protein